MSSILTTPLEKMGLTEGSNIHKRSVISNGGDKEEGKDIIAESSEKHEGDIFHFEDGLLVAKTQV